MTNQYKSNIDRVIEACSPNEPRSTRELRWITGLARERLSGAIGKALEKGLILRVGEPPASKYLLKVASNITPTRMLVNTGNLVQDALANRFDVEVAWGSRQ
jgi:hypothetical protein